VDTVVNTKDFYFTTNLYLKAPTPEGLIANHLMCGTDLMKFYGPCDPELDKMVLKVRAETDQAKRKAMLRDMQIRVAEWLPALLTYAEMNVDVMQQWIKGFTPWPDKMHKGWQYVWLDKA
jgi:ABC-type transport system substrate-binding protein